MCPRARRHRHHLRRDLRDLSRGEWQERRPRGEVPHQVCQEVGLRERHPPVRPRERGQGGGGEGLRGDWRLDSPSDVHREQGQHWGRREVPLPRPRHGAHLEKPPAWRSCMAKLHGDTRTWKLHGNNMAKLAPPWGFGIYLGRSAESDAHIPRTRQDTTNAASVERLVIQRYGKQLLLAVKGIPSDSKAAHSSIPREASPLPETLAAAAPPITPPGGAAAPSERKDGPRRDCGGRPWHGRAAVQRTPSEARPP